MVVNRLTRALTSYPLSRTFLIQEAVRAWIFWLCGGGGLRFVGTVRRVWFPMTLLKGTGRVRQGTHRTLDTRVTSTMRGCLVMCPGTARATLAMKVGLGRIAQRSEQKMVNNKG